MCQSRDLPAKSGCNGCNGCNGWNNCNVICLPKWLPRGDPEFAEFDALTAASASRRIRLVTSSSASEALASTSSWAIRTRSSFSASSFCSTWRRAGSIVDVERCRCVSSGSSSELSRLN